MLKFPCKIKSMDYFTLQKYEINYAEVEWGGILGIYSCGTKTA